MANVRYQLKTAVYMPLDGQWSIVAAGTVFDDAAEVNYSAAHVTALSPSEAAGNLGPHRKATSVRNASRI